MCGYINILKKKFLKDLPDLRSVKVFEDITVPKIRFINMMKDDDRVNSVWAREGVINY